MSPIIFLLPLTSIPLSKNAFRIELPDLLPSLKKQAKILSSNPHTQFALSNPRSQPDFRLADTFPYKITEPFQESGFLSQPPKKPGKTPLSGS